MAINPNAERVVELEREIERLRLEQQQQPSNVDVIVRSFRTASEDPDASIVDVWVENVSIINTFRLETLKRINSFRKKGDKPKRTAEYNDWVRSELSIMCAAYMYCPEREDAQVVAIAKQSLSLFEYFAALDSKRDISGFKELYDALTTTSTTKKQQRKGKKGAADAASAMSVSAQQIAPHAFVFHDEDADGSDDDIVIVRGIEEQREFEEEQKRRDAQNAPK